MKRRYVIINAIAGAILLVLLIRVRPNPLEGKFPDEFSDADKAEISSLIRGDTRQRSFSSLRHGDFKSAWHWLVSARKQRVWSIGEQPNGDTRIQLGVEDKSQPAGYWISARYFLRKTNGHWKVVQLF